MISLARNDNRLRVELRDQFRGGGNPPTEPRVPEHRSGPAGGDDSSARRSCDSGRRVRPTGAPHEDWAKTATTDLVEPSVGAEKMSSAGETGRDNPVGASSVGAASSGTETVTPSGMHWRPSNEGIMRPLGGFLRRWAGKTSLKRSGTHWQRSIEKIMRRPKVFLTRSRFLSPRRRPGVRSRPFPGKRLVSSRQFRRSPLLRLRNRRTAELRLGRKWQKRAVQGAFYSGPAWCCLGSCARLLFMLRLGRSPPSKARRSPVLPRLLISSRRLWRRSPAKASARSSAPLCAISAALTQVTIRLDQIEHDYGARMDRLGERMDQNASLAARLDALEKDALEKKAAVPAAPASELVDITTRLNKLEKTAAVAAAPASEFADLAARLTRLEKRAAAAAASSATPLPPVAPKQSTLTARAETSASNEIGRPDSPGPLLRDYRVEDVRDGVAMVDGRYGPLEVAPGDYIPGAGRVLRIRETGRQLVRRDEPWRHCERPGARLALLKSKNRRFTGSANSLEPGICRSAHPRVRMTRA